MNKIYYLIITDHTDFENNYIEVNLTIHERRWTMNIFSNWYEIDKKNHDRIRNEYRFPMRFKPDIEISEIMKMLKIEEMAI